MTTKEYQEKFKVEYNAIEKQQDIAEEEYNKYLSEYKSVCKGCMNEGWEYCDDMSIIDCYLHRSLPKGVLTKARMKRCTNKCINEITKTINNKILEVIQNGGTK